MKLILVSQILITALVGGLLGIFYAPQQSLSFVSGSGTLFLSFILLGIGYGLIFKKKMIALAVGIIVIKYAILGIIIFTLSELLWFDPLWFSLGVASFVLSAIVYAVREALREGSEHGSI